MWNENYVKWKLCKIEIGLSMYVMRLLLLYDED